MKKKSKPKKNSNPVAKSKATGEHGPKPACITHKSGREYQRHSKHRNDTNHS